MHIETEHLIIKDSKIHNVGAFAKSDLPKGSKIIQYVGDKISKEESKRREEESMTLSKIHPGKGGIYTFELDEEFDIDGNVPENYAKYVNHSCCPNAEADIFEGEIWYTALRDIKKDEEVTINYGFDAEEYKEHPCRCGCENCVGYIVAEDQWPKLTELILKDDNLEQNKIKDKKTFIETEWIVFEQSVIHNIGGFAKCDIPKGTKLIEYVGEKITKDESDRRELLAVKLAEVDKSKGAVYIFELDDEYDIDGDVPYNHAKYINHSCLPNAKYVHEDGKIWIVASRDIKKGEEITYNYGFDMEGWQDHPCKCGSHNCVGYILDEEHWEKLKEEIAKNKSD